MTTKTPIYKLPRHAIPAGAPVQRVEVKPEFPLSGIGRKFSIMSEIGWRKNHIAGEYKDQWHDGLDLHTLNMSRDREQDGNAYAIEPGRIVELLRADDKFPSRETRNDPSIPTGRAWTPYVILAADSGRKWIYRHIEPVVTIGQRINAGEPIARATMKYGFSDWPHLHLEAYEDGQPVDPEQVLSSFGFQGFRTKNEE